ncbi:arylesterase [Mesonia ostreae]|uniref:Arylesterase n=1 Tax=Mesonia ostreae TaxID=861110 RepID=A0ABU2KHV3_9FLAO|nr:arylesterase [Mesonia ostreae]MDT0294291.1 arylesterase [Mesonia ostreae]
MLKLKTTQSLFKSVISTHRNLLKFCYFFTALVMISCGDTTNSKEQEQDSTVTTESEISQEKTSKTILFFGDSITAGYGLDDTNEAFPGLIQAKIDSLGLDYEVINSGLSGETTAGGKSRIEWVLKQDIDIFVLELGANDGLRGVALSETKTNLQAIIDAVKAKSPGTEIILAGMQMPPNMGQEYTSNFKAIFHDLAEENQLAFIPFILEGVGGVKELNQNDGIHPTAKGHKIVAHNVWEVLSTVIDKKS